ncbi:DUF397 domain-containing protein [Streptomyces sp. WAC 00631]|uniref:DUF397 domain-containing protein n=1 Tax=Streptomyces sp. WAC 00631 TaxID=2203201 RepID=UPI000F77E31E|nr:DUF397 domain-containing protein [Streptomyces sp. WAC 00631]MCC5036906.1 DUF397 domain-containing protein [Streptomyces sp. WAC 00631]
MSDRQSASSTAVLAWFKSSYSSEEGGECVEVAASPSAIHVRDSKDIGRPGLSVRPDAWAYFVGFASRADV